MGLGMIIFDDDKRYTITIEVDAIVAHWLIGVADSCHAKVQQVAASIIRDVCEDDMIAEGDEVVAVH